jgi:hypothetical protein
VCGCVSGGGGGWGSRVMAGAGSCRHQLVCCSSPPTRTVDVERVEGGPLRCQLVKHAAQGPEAHAGGWVGGHAECISTRQSSSTPACRQQQPSRVHTVPTPTTHSPHVCLEAVRLAAEQLRRPAAQAQEARWWCVCVSAWRAGLGVG